MTDAEKTTHCHQAANTPRELQLFTMSMNAPILRALGSFFSRSYGAAHGVAEQSASYLSASASSSSDGTLGIQPYLDTAYTYSRRCYHFSWRPLLCLHRPEAPRRLPTAEVPIAFGPCAHVSIVTCDSQRLPCSCVKLLRLPEFTTG